MNKMTNILESISSDVLTDEVKVAITEAFESAVADASEQRINERVELECKNLADRIDDDHTKQVKTLIESIDDTHTKMFKDVVTKIDTSHTKKLKNIVGKFQNELNENATEFKQGLVSKVSKFLDLKIDEMVPKDQLSEAVENIQSRKLVSEIKKLLSYDPDSVNEDVKTALREGYDAIETLKSDLNVKAKENLVLKEEVNNIKSKVILESKCQDLPETKRKFVQKFMSDKTPEYITSNFDYVMEMFEDNEVQEKEVLVENARQKSYSKDVSVPPSQIKNDLLQESTDGNEVTDYVSQMQEVDGFYK